MSRLGHNTHMQLHLEGWAKSIGKIKEESFELCVTSLVLYALLEGGFVAKEAIYSANLSSC